jgi:hypothetical protein
VGAADDLAQRITASIQRRISDAHEEARRQGTSIGLILLPQMSDMFGPARARGHATTETTRGTTAGEQHTMRRTKLVAFWRLGESKSGPCPVCVKVAGLPEHKWPEYARNGPPLHHNCQCYLTWH